MPKSILQTKLWADFKSRQGWKAHQIDAPSSSSAFAEPLFVLERAMPLGKTLLYAPEATLGSYSAKELRELARRAHNLQKEAIFFRLELLEEQDGKGRIATALRKAGFRKAFEETQPEHRQWVDIAGDEASILANMKEKGRYNTRLSEKRGVSARVSTDIKDVEVFYQIFQQTSVRDGFQIRSQTYFEDLCQALFQAKTGEIIIAELEGRPLAALIITYCDGLASYLYGASSNEERQLMAPYAAHRLAIKQAKKHGCHTYDLLQIAPDNAAAGHRYANLTRFKQQFGGRRVDLVGGWDFVYRPFWYKVFYLLQKARRR